VISRGGPVPGEELVEEGVWPEIDEKQLRRSTRRATFLRQVWAAVRASTEAFDRERAERAA
jgi:hypothetical protein